MVGSLRQTMPSDISSEELVEKFREIGEMSITSLVLDHFREELQDPSLEPMSRVFPKFPKYEMTPRLNVLNRLMVTTCLYKTWSAIQAIYPCLHSYCYVIGDADFMFMTRYPYIDVRTHETHGVETVLDFVEFIMEFIIYLCLPCTYRSDKKSCKVLGKEMRDALDECNARGSECPETRRRLLNFVIDSLKSDKPGSATNLPVPPKQSDQMTTFDDSGFRRYNLSGVGETFKKATQKEHPGMFDISVNENVPKSDRLNMAERKMDAAGKNFEEMNDYVVWAIMAGIIEDREEVFQVTFNEAGEADIEYISSGGFKHYLSADAKKSLEADIDMIKAQIKTDGSLAMLSLVERNTYLDRHPFSAELRCCKDDTGRWGAVFSVEVVGHKMRISDLDHLRNQFTTNHVGSNPSMFFENSDVGGVKVQLDFESMPHMSGHTKTSAHAMDFAKSLLDIPFEINDGDDVTHDKIAEMAQSFMEAFYGTKVDVDLNDRVSGMILLGEALVKNDPDKLREMLDFVKDNLRMRQELSKMNGESDLENLLKKAHYLAGERNEKPGIVSTLNTIETLKGVPRMRDAVLEAFEKRISSDGCEQYIDQAVEEELRGSEIFRAHLKSAAGMKDLEKAHEDARLMRLDNASKLTWWWQVMRKQRHGDGVRGGFHLAMYMHSKIEEGLLYNEEALDLFKKMCKKTAYRPLLTNASTLEYKDLQKMWKDVDVALQMNQPRMGKDDWLPQLRDVEWEFFKDMVMFMCLYVILWGIFMKSKMGARTVGHHAAVGVLGVLTERVDLLLLHFLFTGILCNSWNYAAEYLKDLVYPNPEEEKKDDGPEPADGGGNINNTDDGPDPADGGNANNTDDGPDPADGGNAINTVAEDTANLPDRPARGGGNSGARERSGLVRPGLQLRSRHVPPP